jgi:taurine dioxygenase
VEAHPAYPTVPGDPDVQILESTAERPSKIEAWHSDMTFRPVPPALTLLQGRIIPAYGGDTLWASASRAFLALSPPLRTMLEGLYAIHDFRYGFQESLAEAGGAERLAAAVADNPPCATRWCALTRNPDAGRST